MNETAQIDFDHLRQYVGDDASLTAEVFGLFKNQVDMWTPQMRPDLDDDSWEMMTHSLKGTARAIGAIELAQICEEAEALMGEGNRPGARAVAIDKMESCMGQITIEISRWEYRQTIKQMKSETPSS